MATQSLYPQLPVEALELLNDPRVADLRYLGPGMPNDRRVLQPSDPPARGESRFVIVSPILPDSSNARVDWLNEPPTSFALRNQGLASLGSEQPRFKEARKRPKQLPDAWYYMGVLIASPTVAEIMTKYEPAVDVAPIDWTFADGAKLDGYVFLDIHRAVAAYDYKRSEVLVEHDKTGKLIAGLGGLRALKQEIDPSFHMFREAFLFHEIFVSRVLADALLDAGVKMDFVDPAGMHSLKFG